MATFRYTSLASPVPGTIDAPDRAAALRELMRQGVTPATLTLEAQGARTEERSASTTISFGRVMSRVEFASFIRELATAIDAGLPLVTALRTMLKQGRKPRERQMLGQIIDDVEHGRSLADAAEQWGRPFNDLTINLIRAGEASGKLGEVMHQAADLLDADVRTRRSIVSATLYPAILAALLTIAITIVVTVIVPRILKPIEGQIVELPMPTRIVQGLATVVGGYWWLILGAGAVLILALRKAMDDPVSREWIDRNLLRIPALGRLLRDVAVARFTRTLGTLTGAGIPALNALRITKGTLGNKAMERVIDDVCDQVASGRTIADPMERSGYFPAMLVQIVNLGERSGKLDESLRQAADAFEGKTEASVKLVLTVIPPLLVIVLACVVGFVVLAILLPLLEFQEALL